MQKLLPVFAILLFSCKDATISKPTTSFKDSAVKEYLARVDSSDFHDTVNYDFKILKAYFKNDNSFFSQLQKDIELDRKYANEDTYFDTCLQLKKLSDLNVNVAYRFRHSESFCYYSQFVTILKIGDSVLLHYLEISSSPEGKILERHTRNGVERIGPECRIEKEFIKLLKPKDWETLESYIEFVDYWGLKSHNSRLGLDGSSWTIEAYTKRPKYMTGQQMHMVYRWSPVNSFADLGRIFMKLAEEKSLCGEF